LARVARDRVEATLSPQRKGRVLNATPYVVNIKEKCLNFDLFGSNCICKSQIRQPLLKNRFLARFTPLTAELSQWQMLILNCDDWASS
jgi:hypothetical protein